MLVTVEWMRKNYRFCNENYFNGELPENIQFFTNTKERRWGSASCRFIMNRLGYMEATDFKIFMSNAYDSPEEVKLNVLVHEMIHILDYQRNPNYYVYRRNGRWINRRSYDSHGEFFFMPQARRLKRYGFEIARYVSEEEESASQLTDKVAERIAGRKAKGYIIGGAYFKPGVSPADVMWFKTSSSGLQSILDNYRERQRRDPDRIRITRITAYLTHTEKYEKYPGCKGSVKGWYVSNKSWEEMVNELGDDKALIADEHFGPLNEEATATQSTKRRLTDGENGIGKINPDGSVTYIMM